MNIAASRFSSGVLLALALSLLICLIWPRAFGFLPGVVALGGVALWPVFMRGEQTPWTRSNVLPVLVPCAVLVVLSFASTLWAIDPQDSLERAGKLAGVVLGGGLLCILAGAIPVKQAVRFWWVLPAILAGCAVILTAEYLLNYPIYRLFRDHAPDAGIASSVLNRSCVALCLLALPGMTLLYRGLQHKSWPGLGSTFARSNATGLSAATFLGFLIIPMLFLTDSQSAQMAFLLGVLILLLAPVGGKPGAAKWLWAGAGIIVTLAIMTTPFVVQYLFSLTPQDGNWSQYDNYLSRSNYMPRLELWDFVARHALQSPWIGFGIEATRNVEAFDTREIYQPGATLLHPHNAFLQIWIEFGALGAALVSAGVVALLYKIAGQANVTHKRLSLAVLVSVLGTGAVSYGMWQSWWVGFLMALLAVTVISLRICKAMEDNR